MIPVSKDPLTSYKVKNGTRYGSHSIEGKEL